ncbi:hypothetical protein [Planctomicrobium piriforme]|uniref:Cell division protein FtsL n=1 Tax=Planctomicrobium piriforme TaxID=1576369 RepID=A0A1I3P7J4_9PLAN|nr:hypothetical protein [Planctomicrobium piriforme]SFJ17307.1 hypothetical protein SAMN05421753_11657 [Planctomicrobium piriforme]
MFLRFAAAIGLATAMALAAIAVEKQNLSLKRAISLQHYQLEVLQEKRCRLVLESQRLAGPLRLLEEAERKGIQLENVGRDPHELSRQTLLNSPAQAQ